MIGAGFVAADAEPADQFAAVAIERQPAAEHHGAAHAPAHHRVFFGTPGLYVAEPTTEMPEAEWGLAEPLAADVEAFAKRHGFRVARLAFDDPEHLSPLVAELHRGWLRERGIAANRLLVSSFIVMEPYWAMRTGSVPFWMTFNKEPSLESLRAYLDQAEPYDDIHLMLFAHGVESVGLPPIERWREQLRRARRHGAFAGVDEKLFPRDFAVFAR